MTQVLIVVALVFACANACVPIPTAPPDGTVVIDSSGVFVVCEGLWRQDNATLAYLGDLGNVVFDIASACNPGLRLGDTGSDVHVHGDSVFVVINGSRTIEVFHRRTGKWQGRIRFDNGMEPYKLAWTNDTTALCTFLNADAIAELDIKRLQIRIERIPVGPAPEGIAVLGNRAYVAISGLGDLRSSEQGAGTVVVLDLLDLHAIDTLKGLPNVMSIQTDETNGNIWICYRHLRSTPDSLGGVVVYDAATRAIKKSWKFSSPHGIALDNLSGICYVLHDDGVDELSPKISKPLRIIDHSSKAPNDVWYSIGVSPIRQTLYIGNARSYVTNGQVLIFRTNGELLQQHEVGMNPGTIGSGE